MRDFIFNVRTKILFGRDQMKNLASEIKKYGSRVLLAYGGGSIKNSGIYDDVVKIFEDNDIFYKELAEMCIRDMSRNGNARRQLNIHSNTNHTDRNGRRTKIRNS